MSFNDSFKARVFDSCIVGMLLKPLIGLIFFAFLLILYIVLYRTVL